MTKKKVVLDEDFYIKEIGVLDWMYDENQYQKIRLERKGCFQYKLNNQLHRIEGPSIEFFDGSGDLYHLWGENVTWEYHTNNYRGDKLDKTIGPIKTKTPEESEVFVDNNSDSEDIM